MKSNIQPLSQGPNINLNQNEIELTHIENSHNSIDSNNDLDKSRPVPEGGYGWLIVLASFLMQACSLGTAAGFGVFVEYYYSTSFKGSSYFAISLIGTIAPTILCFGSIITGRLCDIYGFKICAFAGAIVSGLSYLIAAFSTEVWHLIISQGFLFGIGGALVYVPANTLVAQWFVKRRGLAIGIGAAGSGLGGMVFSTLNSYLLPKVGYQWTLGYNALIIFVCLTFSVFVIKPFNAIKTIEKGKKAVPFNWSRVKEAKFILFAISTVFAAFGYLVPSYFLPSYATSVGFSLSQGAALVSILNMSSAVGRILLGALGDKLGHLNVYISCIIVSTLSMVIWRLADGYAVLVVFTVLYGLPAGAFVGGFPSACAELFGTENFSTMMGLAFAPAGLGDLAGPSLAGLIYDKTHDYSLLIYYVIVLYCIATFFVIVVKVFYANRERRLLAKAI